MTPTITLVDRLRSCHSGAVYDVLRAKGYVQQTLPHYIRPLIYSTNSPALFSQSKASATILWMLIKASSSGASSCPKRRRTRCSSVSPMTTPSRIWQNYLQETLVYKKVLGYVVDGGCRDSAFIETLGFPVFCKFFSPVDVVGKWAATSLGEPIQVGEVTVRTGDFALADRDGIVIIPAAIAPEVVQQTEEVLRTENLVRKAILQGVDPVAAYLQFGKF